MRISKTVSTSDLKKSNILDIVKVIKRLGPLTKPEITKLTNLTSATVHNFINELLDNKLVIEDGNAKSNGGRKAVLYRINPNFGYIVGQNLGINYISTYIFDMNLELLYEHKISCSLDYSEKVVSLLIQEITCGIDYLDFKNEDCLGIGISIPGQVDHTSGVVKNLTNVSGWKGIPLKSIVESRTGITAFIENDNNVYALALKWLNTVPDDADLVSLAIYDGVGVGVLTGGKIFYGTHSNAGEIGHTTIQYDGPRCNCGNRGCIEVMASDFSIISKARDLKKLDGNTGIETIVEMAKAGEQDILDILKETCGFISIGIDNIIKAYDPEVIVILSKWLEEFPNLIYLIMDNVFSRCKWIKREDLKIIVNAVDKIEHVSAATLVLENIFTRSDGNLLLKRITA